MKYTSLALLFLYFFNTSSAQSLCLTFDDGDTNSYAGLDAYTWNSLLLAQLDSAELQAAFFVKGVAMDNPKGDSIIHAWDQAGHWIGHHTYWHKNLNSKKVSAAFFIEDFYQNLSVLDKYRQQVPWFRFPYLKEGDNAPERDSVRHFLDSMGYRNAHVTIDASDWYYNSRLLQILKNTPKANLEKFKEAYLNHLYDRAMYYDKLSVALTGRSVPHSLLLHHNFINALFLKDLIAFFQSKGWQFISVAQAYTDPIYQQVSNVVPAGESLLWSLSKEKGQADLRYPAEDSVYEKEKIDALGY